jgi:thiamine pyrophosphokinase
LLSRYQGELVFESESETLFLLPKHVVLSVNVGQTLSLIPLNGPVSGITTSGLKWELKDRILDKYFVGISNVATKNEVVVSHESGDLLICINN